MPRQALPASAMPSGLLLPTLQSTSVQCYAGLGLILIGPCNQRERATTAGMHTDTSTDSRGANDRLAPPLVFAASRHLQHHQRGHQQSCDQVQPGFGALSLTLGRRSSQQTCTQKLHLVHSQATAPHRAKHPSSRHGCGRMGRCSKQRR